MRFGPFWKIGQWESQNATAKYMEQLRQYADAYQAKKPSATERYASFFSLSDQSLAQDADLLREAIDNGNDYAVTLDHIAKKKQQAIKQTGGFSAAMRGLGNIAKSVGASLLTGVATAAIGAGISAMIDLIDKQVNAAKYAKEALQGVSAEWDELTEKQKSAGELFQNMKPTMSAYQRVSTWSPVKTWRYPMTSTSRLSRSMLN